MNVAIIALPYDTATLGWRSGAGPEHLVRAGLVERLRSRGHDVATETITDDDDGAIARAALEIAEAMVTAGTRQAAQLRSAGSHQA